MYTALVALLALGTSTAHADPQIDVFDPSRNYVRSINLGMEPSDVIHDMEIDTNGDLYVAVGQNNLSGSSCSPRDQVLRYSNAGQLLNAYGASIRWIRGIAIRPGGGVWASGMPDCGSIQDGYVYEINASGTIVRSTAPEINDYNDVDYYPDGTLFANSHDEYRLFNPSTLAPIGVVDFDPWGIPWPVYDASTGRVVFTSSPGGVGDNSNTFEVTTTGSTIAQVPTNTVGAPFSRISYVKSDGRWVMAAEHEPFTFTTEVLNSQRNAVEATESFALTRLRAGRPLQDGSGNYYIPVTGPRPIDDLAVSLSDTSAGATTTLEYSFTTPHDLPNTALFGLGLGFGMNADSVVDADIELVSGVDGTATFRFDPWFDYYGEEQPMMLWITRDSGSAVPEGTSITLRIDNLVNPGVEGPIDIMRFELYDQWPGGVGIAHGRGDLGELLIGGAGGGTLTCLLGAPVDWDDDGEDDVCIDPSATVDPSVQFGFGAQIGAGVDVQAGVQVGAGTLVRSGSVLAARSSVGADGDLGANTIVGRRTTLGDRVTTASDVVFGRAATVGDDVDLPSFSSVGYGATVGDSVELTNALVLGSLATLGGPAAADPAIQCVGPLTIARSASVAATPDHTLTCLGSAVVGPASVVGSGAVLGNNTRLRKDATVGDRLTTDSNTRLGRGVDVADDVTVASNVTLGANASVCSNAVVSADVARGDSAPGCP